jgi:hypothetical protein
MKWLAVLFLIVTTGMTHARDDGRYANEPLHAWFDQLASGKGLCCSFADGFSIQDVDWNVKESRYYVALMVSGLRCRTMRSSLNQTVSARRSSGLTRTQMVCFLPGAGA